MYGTTTTPYMALYINMQCAYGMVLNQDRGKSRRVDKRKIIINVQGIAS